MKYQKKPVVVEAYQMTRERRWDNKDWPEWLNAAWQMNPGAEGGFWCLRSDLDCIFVGTLEGAARVSFGDWIIRGVKGELYSCKPDIFEETYREAGEERNVSPIEQALSVVRGLTDQMKAAMEEQALEYNQMKKGLTTKVEGLQELTEDIVRLRRATAILNERDRQDDLWGTQDHSLSEWMVILTEEVGELAAAICGELFGQGDTCKKNWREEAVQVAAVALAMLEEYEEEP